MQYGVHGTALTRLGLISSSQCTQVPNVPSSMRLSAARTFRSRLDSRSRLRIANSRSAAFCTSSRASGLFSMVIASRLRKTSRSSDCRVSRISLYLLMSVFVMAVLQFFCYLSLVYQVGLDVGSPPKLHIGKFVWKLYGRPGDTLQLRPPFLSTLGFGLPES